MRIYAAGDSYYNLARYDDAINEYRKIISLYPNSEYVDDAVTGMQWSLMQKGESVEALSVVDTLVTRLNNPDKAAQMVLRKAEFLYNSNSYEAALAQYGVLLRDYPDSDAAANAYHAMAMIHLKQKDPQTAQTLFSKQWTTYPRAERSPDALLQAANLCFAEKNYSRAIELYEKLRTEHPKGEHAATAGYKVGLAYLEQKQYAEQKLFQPGIAERQPDAQPSAEPDRIGAGLYRQQAFPAAVETLENILRVGESDIAAEAQYLLGEAYRGQSDPQAAVIAYLKTKYLYGSESTGWCPPFLLLDNAMKNWSVWLMPAGSTNPFWTNIRRKPNGWGKQQERLRALAGY
jgi:TolA-binding protein